MSEKKNHWLDKKKEKEEKAALLAQAVLDLMRKRILDEIRKELLGFGTPCGSGTGCAG